MSIQKNNFAVKFIWMKDYILDEKGQAVGANGYTWPDKQPVRVLLDMECEKAHSPRRKTFQDLREGYRMGRDKFQLDNGAILRLRLFPTDTSGEYKTDWINVITHNGEETEAQMRFGYVLGKLRTPKAVIQKRQELERDPQVKERIQKEFHERFPDKTMTENDYYEGLERVLAEKMHGVPRFHMAYYYYDPKGIVETDNREELKSFLQKYFSNPSFKPILSTQKNYYRPVEPYLCIRFLNDNGRYTGKHLEFSRSDHSVTEEKDGKYITTFLTPEECVDSIMREIPDDMGRVSVLPGEIFIHSKIALAMDMGKDNEFAIKQAQRLNDDCNVPASQGMPEQFRAFKMGLELTQSESLVVTETLRDFSLPGVDPILINGDGVMLERAEPEEQDSARMSPAA